MAEIPRSSFIPKQPGSVVPAAMQRRRRFHVFGFIATVILVGSLLFAGGAYFYKGVSEQRLIKAQENLKAEKDKFDIAKLNEIRDFNRQILAVRFLLDQHIAPSKIFDVLELNTMERLQFTSLHLTYDPSREILMDVQGSTEEFKTVALQGLSFGKVPLLRDSIISELGTSNTAESETGEDDQQVTFNVKSVLSIDGLAYTAAPRTEALPSGDRATTSLEGAASPSNSGQQ